MLFLVRGHSFCWHVVKFDLANLWWANFMNIVFHSKFQVELQDRERGREADLADRSRPRPPRGALLQQRLQPHVDRRSSQAAKFQGMREDSTKMS